MTDGWMSHYRDELIVTSLVLGLSVFGTFFIASRLQQPDEDETNVQETEEASADVLGEKIAEAVNSATQITPETMLTLSIEPTPSITPGPLDTEVFYGIGGTYAFDDYELIINSPRLTFSMQQSESRTFLVDAILRNKTIVRGISNRMGATVIKDGNVIVAKAALSVNESATVMPGEQLTFQARLSLIDSTDVGTLLFEPETSENKVSHALQP